MARKSLTSCRVYKGWRSQPALKHSIQDVGEDGLARVSRRELDQLLHKLAKVMCDCRWREDRAFAFRIWMASGEPGWRPSPRDLAALRHICAEFLADSKMK